MNVARLVIRSLWVLARTSTHASECALVVGLAGGWAAWPSSVIRWAVSTRWPDRKSTAAAWPGA
jgi:hypothetical protein